MTPNSHPDPETLLSFAAGTLPNAIACVVACHASMCRKCAADIDWLERLGGTILKRIEDRSGDHEDIEAAAARWTLDKLPPPKPTLEAQGAAADPVLPRPLVRYLGHGIGDVPWKTVVKGVRQHWIKLPANSGQLRLLRLTPGKTLLEHTHTGMELTMVLQGIYGDHTGEYERGDVIEWTEGSLHQPHSSGEEECICLVGSESTPYFSRLVARLLRPILGF